MHIQNKVSLQNIIMHNHTNIADNYYLAGYYTGDYMLQSKWQHENGPRMFYPMFGFAYKAINTNVKVSLYKDGESSPVVILDKFHDKIEHNDVDDGWHYFSKNLTNVAFLKSAWDSSTAIKWRVCDTVT